jgi:hypothetical protein
VIIKTILGKKMMCVALAATAITPAAVTHVVDRHVAKKAIAKAVIKAKRERPAFHAKREAIVATDFRAAPVIAEAAAACVPYGGPSGGGFAGGGGTGGFVGIGGGYIGGVGAAPPPVSVSPVPEPSTWAMMSGGMFGIGAVIRRSRKKAADQSP